MLSHLKNVFPQVPTLLLSTTVMPNIFEYIQVSVKFCGPAQIYRKKLDCPNLIYMIIPIRRPKFEDLEYTVACDGVIALIPKTFIFVDNINHSIAMRKYLCLVLCRQKQSSKEAKAVIQPFSFNLEPATWYRFFQDIRWGNTRVWICIECAGMGINLRDIAQIIQ